VEEERGTVRKKEKGEGFCRFALEGEGKRSTKKKEKRGSVPHGCQTIRKGGKRGEKAEGGKGTQ